MGTLNDVGQLSSYNSYWEVDNNQSILNSSQSKLFLFLNYLKTYWFTNIYYHLKSINLLPSKINKNESKSRFNDSSTIEYIRVINLFEKISEEFDIKFVFLTEPYLNIPYQKKSIVESLNKIILEGKGLLGGKLIVNINYKNIDIEEWNKLSMKIKINYCYY